MTKAKLRGARHARRITTIIVAGCCSVSAGAYTVPGGTITFRGALVAPPFGMSTNAGADGATFTANGRAAKDESGTVRVTFSPPVTDAPNATVTIASDSHAVDTRFTDGRGRRIAPGTAGAFHVGATGGVLSMRHSGAKDAQTPKLVTLITSYN